MKLMYTLTAALAILAGINCIRAARRKSVWLSAGLYWLVVLVRYIVEIWR